MARKKTAALEESQAAPDLVDEEPEEDEDVLDEEVELDEEDLEEPEVEPEVEEEVDEEDEYSEEEEGEGDEALDELEAEELELLEDEVSESILVDEVAELRAIRREELTMDLDAHAVREGEFVCQSCFIVKRTSQLANRRKMICRDCAS
ncbi:MAG: DUF4193 family protein [Actinomycetota bacterium]